MSKNTITMELGGVARDLKFNIGTLKHVGELTGIDPFEYKTESTNFTDLLPFAAKIIHSALLSNCASKKVDPDFTAEDVEEWVNDLTPADLIEVINTYNAMFTSKK
jgi:hypothetical protein